MLTVFGFYFRVYSTYIMTGFKFRYSFYFSMPCNKTSSISLLPCKIETSPVTSKIAALTSEIKSLANPASTDSIPTCSDQEDYVSMAPYSGRKLYTIIDNLTTILSIEL